MKKKKLEKPLGSSEMGWETPSAGLGSCRVLGAQEGGTHLGPSRSWGCQGRGCPTQPPLSFWGNPRAFPACSRLVFTGANWACGPRGGNGGGHPKKMGVTPKTCASPQKLGDRPKKSAVAPKSWGMPKNAVGAPKVYGCPKKSASAPKILRPPPGQGLLRGWGARMKGGSPPTPFG